MLEIQKMLLSKSEFNLIRPLNWYKQQYGNSVYNTTDTPEIFWFDFMKNVFVNYFKNQKSITSIRNFDLTQPVLIDDKQYGLELKLPMLEESIVYFAKNQKPLTPSLKIPMCQIVILIISFICFLLLFMIKKYTKFGKIEDSYFLI